MAQGVEIEHSSKRDSIDNTSPMMLPRIPCDHAIDRVQNTIAGSAYFTVVLS